MGMYDYLIAGDSTYQVKVFQCDLHCYNLGDVVPAIDGIETSYSIKLQEDGFYANFYKSFQTREYSFVSVTSKPTFDCLISKWGGPADQENPVLEALREIERNSSR